MNKILVLIFISISFLFIGCSKKPKYNYVASSSLSKPKVYSPSSSVYNNSISKEEYRYAKMNPYTVRGIKYYPRNVNVGDVFEGIASWYGPDFHSKPTANGERYNMYGMTAAHKTLPMNTMLKVTNLTNGLTAIVRINDRGPFHGSRIIDLSSAAAKKINMVGVGTVSVKLEVLGFYSKNGKRPMQVLHKIKKKPIVIPKVESNSYEITKSNYALQIASFTNIEGALQTQEQYDNTDGYTTVIKDVETKNQRYFKVYLKGFKTEKEARLYKENGNFINSFIVKYN